MPSRHHGSPGNSIGDVVKPEKHKEPAMFFEIGELKNIQADLNSLATTDGDHELRLLVARLLNVAIKQQETIDEMSNAMRQA